MIKFLGFQRELKRMLLQKRIILLFWVMMMFISAVCSVENKPRRILLDTDVDTDDLFALLYLLKLNTSQFQLEVINLIN